MTDQDKIEQAQIEAPADDEAAVHQRWCVKYKDVDAKCDCAATKAEAPKDDEVREAAKDFRDAYDWLIDNGDDHRSLPDARSALGTIFEAVETLIRAATSKPVMAVPGEVVKKFQVIREVLNLASQDMRPAAPYWHVDFLSNAVKRMDEALALLTGSTQKEKKK